MLEVLGTYNVTVKELKGILSYLYATHAWVRGRKQLNNCNVHVMGELYSNGMAAFESKSLLGYSGAQMQTV